METERIEPSALAAHDDRRLSIRIFFASFAVGLLARGQAIFGGLYSIDGYFVARMSYDDEVAYNLRDGRILRALLWRLQEALGFSPLASESASLVLATATIAAAAVIFARTLVAGRGRFETAAFALLFSLHPFLTEYFYYGEVSFGIALSVLFAAVAVWSTSDDRLSATSTLGAAAAVFAALSTYQVAIGYVVAGFLLSAARAEDGPFGRAILHRAAALVGGCAAYGFSLVALKALQPAVVGGRAFDAGNTGPWERLHVLGQAVLRALAPQDGIVAKPVAAISCALVACGLLALAVAAWRRRGALAGLVVVVASASALAVACLPSIMSRTPWLAPRLLSPSVLVFATLAVACLPARNSWRRRVWTASACAVLLGYFASDASILFDQRRVNAWDQRIANRIVARLEAQPGFADARRLAVVGTLAAHPFPLSTHDHDLNASAFSAAWSKSGAIEQATGLSFERATQTDIEAAKAYCAERDKWPGPASVSVVSKLAVVCLSKPE